MIVDKRLKGSISKLTIIFENFKQDIRASYAKFDFQNMSKCVNMAKLNEPRNEDLLIKARSQILHNLKCLIL